MYILVLNYIKGIGSLKKGVLKQLVAVCNRKLCDNLLGDFLCPVVTMDCQPAEILGSHSTRPRNCHIGKKGNINKGI